MEWTGAGSLDPTFIGHACALRDGGAFALGTTGEHLGVMRPAALRWSARTGWSAATALPEPVAGAALVLLADGRVLAAGGVRPGYPHVTPLDTVEIWDPATDTWSAASPLPTARRITASVLLADGSVLACGEEDARSRASPSCALYRPDRDEWIEVAPLPLARSGHSAVRLRDGSVLVAGGFTSGKAADMPGLGAPAWRFVPATRSWEPAGSLTTHRKDHALIALADGGACIAGGWQGKLGELDTIERFDPVSASWTLAGVLLDRRQHVAAACLPDGRVLFAGGTRKNDGNVDVFAGTEIWDPRTGESLEGPVMKRFRMGPDLLTLADGSLLAVGGILGGERQERGALTERLILPG